MTNFRVMMADGLIQCLDFLKINFELIS